MFCLYVRINMIDKTKEGIRKEISLRRDGHFKVMDNITNEDAHTLHPIMLWNLTSRVWERIHYWSRTHEMKY